MEYDSELKFGYKDELATQTQQYKHAQTTKKRKNYRSSFIIPALEFPFGIFNLFFVIGS